MKKIFALLAIAAMATTLMTACGDDEETADNTYKITKGSETWEAASIEAYDHTTDGYITLIGNKNNTISVNGYLQALAGTYNYETSLGDYMTYIDQNDLYPIGGENYANCIPNEDSWSETINAIDLTALTLSGEWSEEATTYADALNHYDATTQTIDFSACTEKYNLSGKMQNIHWDTWSTAKANTAKTKLHFVVK